MKKTLFKALLPTMAMILVAVMALTGTTYAWFTTNYTATVSQIDITVTDASSMKIAMLGKNDSAITSWTNSISASDIKDSKNAVWQNTASMNAVSSVTGSSGSFYTVKVDAGDSTKITDANANTTDYLYFEVYIWNDSTAAKNISLDGSSITGSSGVIGALRLSLVDMGTVATSYNGASLPYAAGAEKTATIWEPAGASATQALNAGILTSAAGSLSVPAASGSYTSTQSTVASASALSVNIPASSVEKVAIYIWLEGQDADCTNSITKNLGYINITFDGTT